MKLATNEESSISAILGWEKNVKRHVLDPIHGPIGVTDLESDLIHSEVFTRLKNIKQLGFVSNIYPSATHTRFEHSLGTLAVTWDILKRILKKLEENVESDIITLFTYDVIKSYRLAALLHDLGHGPFSHAMEDALKYLGISFDHDELTSYLLSYKLSKESIDSIRPSFNTSDCTKLRDFRRELAGMLKPNLRILTLAILDLDFSSSSIPEGFGKIRFFLHDTLKGDIGSDRIDYLLRDTYFTGLGHRFSLSEILDSLYYVYDKMNNRLILAIRSEGKAALELMLLTRYFHYQFIAHHRENVKLTAGLQLRMKFYLEDRKVKNYQRRKREKVLLDIALSNDWIEKDFRKLKDISPVHSVALLDFRDFVSRFIFYRVIEDNVLKSVFQNAIETYILNEHDVDARNKMLFSFSVGKPRVPIIHYYMEKYMTGKVKQSTLVHDHSPFLFSLGRAYIENSSMRVYTTPDLKSELKEVFYEDPNFYKDRKFLQGILREVTTDSLNVHDYLLFILYNLTHWTVDKTIRRYEHVTAEYRRIMRNKQLGNDYSLHEKCYDHETNSNFDCPSRLFNGLILFDVCKFIDIELVTSPYKKVGEEQTYKPSYNIEVREHEWKSHEGGGFYYVPLKLAIKRYPKAIARFFDI